MLKELAVKNYSFALVGEERTWEVRLELFNHWRMRCRLKQCLSETCSTTKRDEQDALLDISGYDAFLSWSSAFSDSTLFHKRGLIGRYRKEL